MRALAAFALAAAVLSAAAARVSDIPGCPDPDLAGLDILGRQKLALLRSKGIAYDEAQFESMEGDGSALIAGTVKASRVIIKAPIHTCRIKQTPGLREWVNEVAERFSGVEVQPFSQPPNINFFGAEGELIERVKILDDVTVADITAFLRTRGVHGTGQELEDSPLSFDDGEEDEDVRRAREAATMARERMAQAQAKLVADEDMTRARAQQASSSATAAAAEAPPRPAMFTVDVSGATGEIGVDL